MATTREECDGAGPGASPSSPAGPEGAPRCGSSHTGAGDASPAGDRRDSSAGEASAAGTPAGARDEHPAPQIATAAPSTTPTSAEVEPGAGALEGGQACAVRLLTGGSSYMSDGILDTGREAAGGEGRSFVHPTPQLDNCTETPQNTGVRTPEEVLWIRLVSHESADWREARARHHELTAQRAEELGELGRADWHRRRASGLRHRYERAEVCGTATLHKTCRCCGSTESRQLGCKRHSVCATCRAQRAHKRADALTRGIQRHAKAKATRAAALRGWRWRWVTLTVPHSGDVSVDVGRIQRAWPRLARELRRQHGPRLAWARSLEITTSSGGHAHVHALVWSPWTSQAWLAWTWGRLLEAEGADVERVERGAIVERERERRGDREAARVDAALGDGRLASPEAELPWCVVDVRAIEGAAHGTVATYASKGIALYASKGTSVDGGSPRVASEIERATYGVRTTQTSRGLMDWPEPLCADCGERAWAGVLELPQVWRPSWDAPLRPIPRAPPPGAH